MRSGSRVVLGLFYFFTGLLFCFGAVYGLIIYRFGSFDGAINVANGKVIAVDRSLQPIAQVTPSSRRTVVFHLTNRGFAPVRLVGFTAGCMVEQPPEMPLVLDPMQKCPFPVTLNLPADLGALAETSIPVTLYSSASKQHEINLVIELNYGETGRPVASR